MILFRGNFNKPKDKTVLSLIVKDIFVFLFVLNVVQSQGQVTMSDVNLDNVPQKKVREYIIEQEKNNVELLTEIKPSMRPDARTDGYHIQVGEYFLKDSLNKVWQHYVNTNPGDSWNGKRVSFGMLFSNKDKKVVYRDESVAHLDTGQVVYLNLKLLKGIMNLATVFELTSIDKENRVIEFSYIDGNITKGKQRLQFIETARGYTEIIHTSYYKSSSAFRDRFLYPFFHTKVSNDFHRNMKKLYFSRSLKM